MKPNQDPVSGKFLSFGPNPTVEMPDGTIGIVIVHNNETHMAVVDAEDYPKVKDHRWCLISTEESHHRNTTYARAMIRVDGKRTTIRMHQLIAGGPGVQIDHRDGVGLRNVRSNLRVTDHTGNARNRGCNRNSASGIKGVYLRKDNGMWRASIKAGPGKRIYLGQFGSANAARNAYDTSCVKLHGVHAHPNDGAVRLPDSLVNE